MYTNRLFGSFTIVRFGSSVTGVLFAVLLLDIGGELSLVPSFVLEVH